MFVSHRYRLIFLEVPRTASRSISRALMELDPAAPTARARQRHGGAHDYHNFRVDKKYLDDYWLIATHRNPYDRLWSYWKHRHRKGNPDIFKSISWPRYVEWVCSPSAVPEIQGANRDLPITEMFDCSLVSFWLKYEELHRSWRELAMRCAVPLPELGHMNRSEPLAGFGDAYDQKLAQCVRARFAADFELFGYSQDSWRLLRE